MSKNNKHSLADSSIIPVEPDTQEALAKALKLGQSAKVRIAGDNRLFLMSKAETGNDFELVQIQDEGSSDNMRQALLALKGKLK